MFAAILGVWALLVGLSVLMLGGGLQGTLPGLRATSEGFGLVMSAYYAGFIGSSWACLVPMVWATDLRFAAADKLGVGRLGKDDPGFRPVFAQNPGNSGYGSASAVTGHPIVKPLAGKIGHDLARRGVFMNVGIGVGLEPAGRKSAIGVGQLLGLVVHAGAFSVRGVSTTLAPGKRISRRRSIEKLSAMVTTRG